MSATDVPFAHAFAMERAVRVYKATLGQRTIPCNEFCGRNSTDQRAPMTWSFENGERKFMVLPDLIDLPGFSALEIKTQGYSPYMRKAQARTTGFFRRHYDHYRNYEQLTGKPVSIAFVHLVEDEIRGGPLSEIEFAKTPRINVQDFPDEFYWEYDQLPRWPISLSDLLGVALRHSRGLGTEGYSDNDHASVTVYTETVAKPNAEKHRLKWGSPEAAVVAP